MQGKKIVKFRNYLITGIAVVFPLILTIIVIKFVINKINAWVLSPFINFFQPYLHGTYAVLAAKLAIFLLVLLFIYVIGFAANIIVIRKFFGAWESIFLRVPLLGKLYKAFREIGRAVFRQDKTIFREVVLIQYPRLGVYSIGFLTCDEKWEVGNHINEDYVSVFIPTVPNPTTGFFVVIPNKEVIRLNMSIEEGMKMVISCGAVVPGNQRGLSDTEDM